MLRVHGSQYVISYIEEETQGFEILVVVREVGGANRRESV